METTNVAHDDIINLSQEQQCKLSNDFFDSHWFECALCPEDILTMDFYINVGLIFKGICESLMSHYEDTTDFTLFPSAAYAFFTCPDEPDSIIGACGKEINPEDGSDRFKFYINPLIISPNTPTMQQFRTIFEISVHEVSHAILSLIDPHEYALGNNVHPDEWNVLCHEFRIELWDMDKLYNEINIYLKKDCTCNMLE